MRASRLPQRVSSRSLRTGETRLRRGQQPVTSVGRRRQRCGGARSRHRLAEAFHVELRPFQCSPGSRPSGCGVRLPGAGTQPTRRQLLVTGPTAAGRGETITFAPRSCGGFVRRVTCPQQAPQRRGVPRGTPSVRQFARSRPSGGGRAPGHPQASAKAAQARPTHGRAARTAVVPASAAAPGDGVSPDGPPERVRPDVFHVEPHARTDPVAPSPCREDVGASRVLWRGALHLM